MGNHSTEGPPAKYVRAEDPNPLPFVQWRDMPCSRDTHGVVVMAQLTVEPMLVRRGRYCQEAVHAVYPAATASDQRKRIFRYVRSSCRSEPIEGGGGPKKRTNGAVRYTFLHSSVPRYTLTLSIAPRYSLQKDLRGIEHSMRLACAPSRRAMTRGARRAKDTHHMRWKCRHLQRVMACTKQR